MLAIVELPILEASHGALSIGAARKLSAPTVRHFGGRCIPCGGLEHVVMPLPAVLLPLKMLSFSDIDSVYRFPRLVQQSITIANTAMSAHAPPVAMPAIALTDRLGWALTDGLAVVLEGDRREL